MSRRETATKLVAAKVILDELTASNSLQRNEAKEVDFDVVGVREAAVLGDEAIGFVQLNKGRESWTVTDPAAFLAWVQEHRPDEIVTRPSVRSSYTTAVLQECKNGGVLVDAATGETAIPDGVECRQGDPILQVKPGPDARRVVLNAIGDAAVVLGLAERAELES